MEKKKEKKKKSLIDEKENRGERERERERERFYLFKGISNLMIIFHMGYLKPSFDAFVNVLL